MALHGGALLSTGFLSSLPMMPGAKSIPAWAGKAVGIGVASKSANDSIVEQKKPRMNKPIVPAAPTFDLFPLSARVIPAQAESIGISDC